MGIFKKEDEVKVENLPYITEAQPKRVVVRMFKIKTYFNEIVEGKNKRFTKHFVIWGKSKKDALLRFYDLSFNTPYVVKEICPLDYKGK